MKKLHRIRSLAAALAVAAIPATALVAQSATGATAATTKATATATTTSCPRGWGSLPEASTRVTAAQLTNVRSGRHACYDRLVIDLNGRPAGYLVRYVANVYQDGSGHLVPLRGGAKLELIVRAPDHDFDFKPTYRPANLRELTNVAGYRTFRQVAYAGSFEGQTTIGLGVRARLPFRVLTLTGPGTGSRLVVDVAHTW